MREIKIQSRKATRNLLREHSQLVNRMLTGLLFGGVNITLNGQPIRACYVSPLDLHKDFLGLNENECNREFDEAYK